MIRSSRWWVAFSLVAALSAGFAPASRAIIDNGPAGGGVTVDWDGVGTLDPNFSGFAPATATLIDSTHLLTAAHAVYNSTTNGPVANNVFTFHIGGIAYNVSAVNVDPNYKNGSDQYDIAVITLTGPVTGHTIYGINTGSINEMSEPVTLVGYGIGGDGTNGINATAFPFGTKRAGVNAIDVNTDKTSYNPGSGTLPAGLLVYDFDNASTGTNGPLGGPAIASNEGDTTDGDSGGPMFQFDPISGKYLITGITSNGTDDLSRFGDISWGTRVSDYSSFVGQFVAVPEPVSLTPLLLGLAMLSRRRRTNRA